MGFFTGMTSGAMTLSKWGLIIGGIGGLATGDATMVVGLPLGGALIGGTIGAVWGTISGFFKGVAHSAGPAHSPPEQASVRAPSQAVATQHDMSHVKGGHVAREMARRAGRGDVGQGIG